MLEDRDTTGKIRRKQRGGMGYYQWWQREGTKGSEGIGKLEDQR